MKRRIVTLILGVVVVIGALQFALTRTSTEGLAQVPSMSLPSPVRIMEAIFYGAGTSSLQVSTLPQLRSGFQIMGFCSGGGTTATLNTAQTVYTPCDYQLNLVNNPTSITVTTLSTSNVATINILWSDGTAATAVAPPAVGSSTTFTTASKTTNLQGFTLVTASSATLAANTTYNYQGTFVTVGN